MNGPGAPATLPPTTRASLKLAGLLAASWLLLIVIGFFALRSDHALAAGNRVAGERAAFVSANVSSLAGFQLDFARPDDFAWPVRALFVVQTLSGAMLSLVGGGVLWARLLRRPFSDSRITVTALAMIALAAVLGCVTIGGNDSVLVAAMRGISALGCGGVLFGEAPLPQSAAFKLALVPLSVLGSFGVVVVNDVIDQLRHRLVSIGHVGRVMSVTAIVYLLGLVWIGGAISDDNVPWQQTLVRADALTWSAHAWGAPLEFPADASWPPGVVTAVIAIAVIGVGSAGTAASFGLAWLWTAPRRLQPMIINGLIGQALIASSTLAALAWADSTLPRDRRFMLVVSAVMNLGLSYDSISMTGFGLVALSFAIVAAKLLPIVVFATALTRKGKL